MSEQTSFEITQKQLDECVELLKLDPGVHAILRMPMREIHVSLPVRMDDGSLKVFQGYRVQYNNAKGPTKGGIRFHPDKTIDNIRAQAAWMTWKCALLDLPLGGAGGGILCNPKEMSRGELERLSRAYIDQLSDFIGPEKDIPAPDVYTDPQVMAWMMDEYFKINRANHFGVITGKPLAIGGSIGRTDAAARGAMYAIREAAQVHGLDLTKATVAVQGYGNAGYFAALLASTLYGCKVIAASDTHGGIFNENGLDAEAIRKQKSMTGSVVGLPNTEPITNEELLELKVDILIPAALENVITETNAPRIKATILAELSNGPTTPEADAILLKKGVHQIPDFLCNAGGVTVSYFEMVQNAYMYYWDKELVHSRLDKKMTSSYNAVHNTATRFNIDMRKAAYAVAVMRVVEAMKCRGWI
ncbi:MAG: Glu/Leu/Phe/Val dehydrogenase [Candidatus Omnitrophota bacterium]|nr:MAG: Glu/Leu/Phe/Val dehydrogenase [Candidatus Omnitrophota bacterium]